MPLAGTVARHVEKDGEVAAVAIQFDIPAESETLRQLVDDVRGAAHARQLGGITGPIDALGLANLLQMFSSCSDRGTLRVMSEGEVGRVVFEGGTLRHAATQGVDGLKALSRILAWDRGAFEFHPVVDSGEPESCAAPMYGAVLEALQHVDELKRLDLGPYPPDARIEADSATGPRDASATAKIQDALLERVAEAATVRELVDAVPEFDSSVYEALTALVDQGVVRILP